MTTSIKEGKKVEEEYVYRISTSQEWEELQTKGSTFGGDLDKSTLCFHLSLLPQVLPTLHKFYSNPTQDLLLLQIQSNKVRGNEPWLNVAAVRNHLNQKLKLMLGDGLIYELVEGNQWFPHYYGPSRSFAPLPLEAVTRAEKLTYSDGKFSCVLFD